MIATINEPKSSFQFDNSHWLPVKLKVQKQPIMSKERTVPREGTQ